MILYNIQNILFFNFRGQESYFHYRFMVTTGMVTGLVAVLAIPTILKVLISTKQSSSPMTAYRRYIRTIMHVVSWHSHPLVPGTEAWKSMSMVRNAHKRSSKYSIKKDTGIISQTDLALTQFGFLGFVMLEAEKYGMMDQDYFEGNTHLWRTIGHMLGLSDEFNLCTDSWESTRPRLLIVRDEIFKPSLENTSPEFTQMITALIDGLWAYLPTLTIGSFLFFTKRMAGCRGYEFFQSELLKDTDDCKLTYYDLSWRDRFYVSYGLFLTERLYRFSIVRNYMNFRTWLDYKINMYFPFRAIVMFGIKAAYVRIFHGTKANELHID